MIPEIVAFVSARRLEEFHTRSALPDSPIQPDGRTGSPGQRFAVLRMLVCADLRRLADRIEPAPRRSLTTSSAHGR